MTDRLPQPRPAVWVAAELGDVLRQFILLARGDSTLRPIRADLEILADQAGEVAQGLYNLAVEDDR